MRAFLSMLFFCVASSAVSAQVASECKSVESVLDRLACFDGAYSDFESEEVVVQGGIGESVEPPTISPEVDLAWEVREERDPITDRRNVSYLTTPTEKQYNVFGGEKRVALQLRCWSNTTAAIVYFDEFQVRLDEIDITVRKDREAPVEMEWAISTSKKSAGLWLGRDAIPFIKSLEGGSELVMRLKLEDGTDTYTFNIEPVGQYIAELGQACEWGTN